MPTGTNRTQDLGLPLNGEYQQTQLTAANDMATLTGTTSMSGDYLVLEDVDGTEQLWVNYLGAIYIRNEITDTGALGAYMGVDARSEIIATSAGTWYAGCGFRITNSATVGAQVYAGNFHWIGSAAGNHTGGRGAVINLIADIKAGYGGASWNTMAFINMDDQATDVPSLFSFPGITASSGGCFSARSSITGTHGLSINVGNTQYFIMVAETS